MADRFEHALRPDMQKAIGVMLRKEQHDSVQSNDTTNMQAEGNQCVFLFFHFCLIQYTERPRLHYVCIKCPYTETLRLYM